jgi:hypothetical protein
MSMSLDRYMAGPNATREPESRKRMISVAAASNAIASGRWEAIALRSSWNAAASPPTTSG